MKKCKNCKRFKPISYVGGDKLYPYCKQEHAYVPCNGVECDYPDMYEPKMNYHNEDIAACENDGCKERLTCLRWWLGTNKDPYQTYLNGCEGEFYVEFKQKNK